MKTAARIVQGLLLVGALFVLLAWLAFYLAGRDHRPRDVRYMVQWRGALEGDCLC